MRCALKGSSRPRPGSASLGSYELTFGSPQPLYGDVDIDVSGINISGHLSDGGDKRLYDGQITGERCGAVAATDADGPALLYDSGVLLNSLRGASRDVCATNAPPETARSSSSLSSIGASTCSISSHLP